MNCVGVEPERTVGPRGLFSEKLFEFQVKGEEVNAPRYLNTILLIAQVF